MKNRAKCRLCKTIIESFHPTDYVSCKCGEISIDGGDALLCSYKDISNFLRVDDEGNEIIVKEVRHNTLSEETYSKPTKKDLLKILDEMITNIENLPAGAMNAPITHYDYVSGLLLLSAIFREFCKEDI